MDLLKLNKVLNKCDKMKRPKKSQMSEKTIIVLHSIKHHCKLYRQFHWTIDAVHQIWLNIQNQPVTV